MNQVVKLNWTSVKGRFLGKDDALQQIPRDHGMVRWNTDGTKEFYPSTPLTDEEFEATMELATELMLANYNFTVAYLNEDGSIQSSNQPLSAAPMPDWMVTRMGVWDEGGSDSTAYYDPNQQCKKCNGYRTELRRLFTGDYTHCFNCDGGSPTPKGDLPTVDLSNIKY